ncbi:MAG: B12-binding domain-containing radical SAM protein [Desulfatibacillum sp.]|nr:B12-binding domain-containing radical SAM protein [Desulfatibacillum sp.]
MPHALLIKTRRQAAPETGDGVSPPLGLMCLAAYARKQRPGKDQFTLVDERVHEKSDEEWDTFIEDTQPDCIAISALTVETDRLAVLVPHLKKRFPQIPLFLGGPHASSAGPEFLRQIPVNFLVAGEGENAFVCLLEMVEQQLPHIEGKVSGLAYLNKAGEIVHWPRNQNLVDVEDLPIPAWDLIDLKDYQHLPRMTPFNTKQAYAPLVTSRGCPYHCIYCHDIFAKKFRPMTARQVVDEIEYLITTYDIHEFEIFDDVFNLDKKRVLDICREIKKRQLSTAFTFPNGVRSDILDREVLEALTSVGTYHIAFAVESATPRIQNLARKNIDLDKVRKNIGIASDLGIFCWGFFMLGFPTESRREIWSTLRWAWASPLHGAFFFQVIPHEGTALAKEFAQNRAMKKNGRNPDYFDAKGSMAQIGPLELWLTQSMAYLLFLMAPRRLWAIYRHAAHNGGRLSGTVYRFLDYLVLQKPKNLVQRISGSLQTGLRGQHR